MPSPGDSTYRNCPRFACSDWVVSRTGNAAESTPAAVASVTSVTWTYPRIEGVLSICDTYDVGRESMGDMAALNVMGTSLVVKRFGGMIAHAGICVKGAGLRMAGYIYYVTPVPLGNPRKPLSSVDCKCPTPSPQSTDDGGSADSALPAWQHR